MIRIVTDSASMIPPALRERFAVDVVPLTITLDGVEHHEGIDLTTDDFYARLSEGAVVATSAPSPGSILDAYRRAERDGADHVLSVHTGSNYSATVTAATVAAGMATVAVTVIDTGLASFPVTLALWSAADALGRGEPVDVAAAAAHSTASATGSVFVVGVPDLARRGGRFVTVDGDLVPTSILELDGSGLRELVRADDLDAAIDAMSAHVCALAAARPLRAGIGDAVRPSLADALEARLSGAPGIVEIVRYEVGPSVGAHTGAGTVGVVYAPAS